MQLREGLAWSQSLAKDFNGALDAYSARLTDLQLAVAAVAQRSQVNQGDNSSLGPIVNARMHQWHQLPRKYFMLWAFNLRIKSVWSTWQVPQKTTCETQEAANELTGPCVGQICTGAAHSAEEHKACQGGGGGDARPSGHSPPGNQHDFCCPPDEGICSRCTRLSSLLYDYCSVLALRMDTKESCKYRTTAWESIRTILHLRLKVEWGMWHRWRQPYWLGLGATSRRFSKRSNAWRRPIISLKSTGAEHAEPPKRFSIPAHT